MLNEHVFTSLSEARRIVESWRIDYNTVRPHSSLAAPSVGCSLTGPSHGAILKPGELISSGKIGAGQGLKSHSLMTCVVGKYYDNQILRELAVSYPQ